ncbi:MAG: 1-hydroxycarotenoid 3,4-desaturase CrtD [Niveispirillum sp.]|uniref:1-hydroxycarotenoid 3,4-desaturase CrtD n=1 Tax=Niveispirillum sp. TaxID=1917217 RepID=UPI000A8E4FE7
MSGGTENDVVIVGAGMGGLSAALVLASAGFRVVVVDGAAGPGGKLRQVAAGRQSFDAGPTVLTMKWVFDALLSRCGTALESEVGLVRSDLLARHYWRGGEGLDLFADLDRNADAIGDFAGAREAAGFRRFANDSARIYRLLERSFIDAPRPNPLSLSARIGLHRPGSLLALKPYSTLWSALSDYFADPRLRQLFGRYATYCGSSPFLAPATLMLVAHVEQDGVWIVEGGMHLLARRLMAVAERLGVVFRFAENVVSIDKDRSGRAVTGVTTDQQRQIGAASVIFNGDAAALAPLLEPGELPRRRMGQRSLSALVACGSAIPSGVPLAHHTVFFSDDYKAEFDAILHQRRPPADPTIYVCAQDRTDAGALRGTVAGGGERLYSLINMPADGDGHAYTESEIDRCLSSMERRLARNGLTLPFDRRVMSITAPDGFNRLFPGTGGALYGMASHGAMASFRRPSSQGPITGLYLAGGSVHPGPGVPMAALSGKIAAERLLADRALIDRSRPVAITGGMPMRSVIADTTP